MQEAGKEPSTKMADIRVYSARNVATPAAVFRDLREGLALGPVWRVFAWDEIQNRYRRSALGIGWIAIAYLIFVLGIALFFGPFSGRRSEGFLQYVAVGYAGFAFLVGNLTDGCAVFTSAANWIKSAPLPYSIYIYKSIARSLFPFAIQISVALGVLLLTGWRPTFHLFMVLPALLAYLVNAVWIQLTLGLVAARYRDLKHLVAAVQRILLFATPILWVYEERSGWAQRIATANPLTHFLEIFRAPILGEPVSLFSWGYVLIATCVGWLIALTAATFMRRRLPFWV